MKHRLEWMFVVLLLTLVASGVFEGGAEEDETFLTAAGNPAEGALEPFLGEPEFDTRKLFDGGRFPNVIVAVNGTVLVTWGDETVHVRRSEDGGESWGDDITIGKGVHGGGVTVDERNGNVLAFTAPGGKAPATSSTLYRSTDHGRTWTAEETEFHEDLNGHVPSLHMAEHGITLRHGKHRGRLIRPARVQPGSPSDAYNTAIYSDDHGETWHTGEPFPMKGTGEGAVAELSGGRMYYSSRKHWFKKVADFTHRRSIAWSNDGGETWMDAGFDTELPDGPRYRGKQGRGANYNGHFGMMCGLVRLPVEDRDVLLYSNADTPNHKRVRMTVWASFDGGRTWPVKRLIHGGPGAYSSLAAGRPGTTSEGWVYLLFEGGEKHKYAGARMARFNLAWLLQGETTGDGEVPGWVSGTNGN